MDHMYRSMCHAHVRKACFSLSQKCGFGRCPENPADVNPTESWSHHERACLRYVVWLAAALSAEFDTGDWKSFRGIKRQKKTNVQELFWLDFIGASWKKPI